MLKKLIKYDLIYSKNSFFALGITLVCATLVISFGFDFLSNFGIFAIGFVLLASISVTGVVVASVVLLYQNFAKSLFSDHGYLMFTLPVKRETLLITKGATSLIWLNFMCAITATMLFIIELAQSIRFDRSMNLGDTFLIELTYAFVHANVIGFMFIGIFFAMITLSKSYFAGRKVHWVLSIIAGFIYLTLWGQTLDWLFDSFGFGTVGFGAGQRVSAWSGATWYAVEYDFLLIGSALLYGIMAYIATLYMLKNMELR